MGTKANERSGIEADFRRGYAVFGALVVLTVVEFVVAHFSPALLWVTPPAVAKAVAILFYFMHMPWLWRKEETAR